MGRKKGGEFLGLDDGSQGVFDEEAWLREIERLALLDGTIVQPNYVGKRQRGRGTYEQKKAAIRAERAGIMAENSTPETEALNEESMAAVVAVLSRADLFPWIESVEVEEDRLGDDDWIRKTDAYVNLSPELCAWGLCDQFRLQVKSGWADLEGLGNKNIKKLLGLTSNEWRKLKLILLFGQATTEAIAASFCDQIINYMKMAGIQNAREEFKRYQSSELLRVMDHYEALDIAGRDWEVLLSWIAGRPTRREQSGKSSVTFI